MSNSKHFIGIYDTEPDILEELLILSEEVKKQPTKYIDSLKGKTLVMYFEKPSTRTRLSFEIGMTQLGGHAIYFGKDSHLSHGKEDVKDTARVISRYADLFMARVFHHSFLIEYSKYSSIPVINALSDLEHPCQALADLLTIKEKKGFEDTIITYIGDGNNVANSLMMATTMLGMEFRIASPPGYEVNASFLQKARKYGKVILENDPKKVVEDSDVIYTDVWVSMGDEKEKDERMKVFKDYTVTEDILERGRDPIFMHCLPALKGKEVTENVFESKSSVVFDQAENRLHSQKALMLYLLNTL